jgi:hypothetical protein
MKTFKQYIEEANRIFPDVASKKQFGDDTKMKLLSKGIVPPEQNPNKPVDTTGANSPFADPKVKSYTVSPDKPMIGKDDSVSKALAAKGYGSTGEKMRATSYPNVSSARAGMATDTKIKLSKINQKIDTSIKKANPSVVKSEPKMSDAGIKKSVNKFEPVKTKVPIPKAKPAATKQTFKQAFASAPEGSEFTWQGKKYKRITKKG